MWFTFRADQSPLAEPGHECNLTTTFTLQMAAAPPGPEGQGQVSSLPLPPMHYVNLYTDENIKRGRAPKPPPPIKVCTPALLL